MTLPQPQKARKLASSSGFASSPPVVDPNAAPASMVWSYIGELIFNMLILVGAVKMADRLVKEMVGI